MEFNESESAEDDTTGIGEVIDVHTTRQGKKVHIFIVLTILIQLIFHQNSLIYHFILSVIPSITHLKSYSF